MFRKHSNAGYNEAMPGIELKTVAHGEKTLMAKFLLKKGSLVPLHSHPHEQIGYLVSGRIRLTIDLEANDAMPGDSWCIPGGVEHSAEIFEDAVAVEVFSPVREDYLPKHPQM